MPAKFKAALVLVIANLLTTATVVLARGGGGGSGGGGGGGFGGGSGSGGGGVFRLIMIIIFSIVITAMAYAKNKQLQARDIKEQSVLEAAHEDVAAIKQRVGEIFHQFEAAWSNFDLAAMKNLLTEEYYKRMVLELNVLQNEKRQNVMNEVSLSQILIYDVTGAGTSNETVTVRISAVAQDSLIETDTKKRLSYDSSQFIEYWHLVKDQGVWKLNLITQETENAALVENDIANFAKQNGFYYDADFGWLMMPNKGVIFKNTNFETSDINNHVLGYFRGKIVEFYTYIPSTNSRTGGNNYLVAQAILPISYKDILIKKKGWFNFSPWGFKKITLESADFNNKFCLWADPQDQVNSLELLTPNFMEKIYALPFELNIEIVGNVLYFYTKGRGAANYPKMLEILSWAFDEMKM